MQHTEPVLTPPNFTPHPRSLIVTRAALQAQQDFAGHLRKSHPDFPVAPQPFFHHLKAVASTLERYGYRDVVVAAGYLHDHLEDLPHAWNKARLAAEFGSDVATLVDWVTQQDKSLSWEERNNRYFLRLQTAPDEALGISAADKLSNIGDLLPFLRAGIPLNAILKRGWQINSEKFHDLLSLFQTRIPTELSRELSEALSQFDELGAALER